MFGSPETQSQEPQNYSSHLENQLREMNHLITGQLKIASDKMKTRYDIRSNTVGFQEGDQVWLFNPKRRRGRSHKLQSNWEGSYTVKKRINDVVYRIQQKQQRKFKFLHLYRLAKYYFRHGLSIQDEQA